MVACFQTKEAYTSHYQTLAFFSVLGVEVTLLRGYKFRQTNFLSSYVKMCADQRKKATNPADKNIHKLMANIIFGKVSVLLLCSTKWILLKNNLLRPSRTWQRGQMFVTSTISNRWPHVWENTDTPCQKWSIQILFRCIPFSNEIIIYDIIY